MMSPNNAVGNDESPASGRLRRLPPEHYDTTPIRKVSLQQWQAVWPRLGQQMPGLPASIEEVVEVLTQPGLPHQCHDLLQVLHELGTPLGAQVFHDAAICFGVDRGGWPDAVEALAVEVWLRALDDPDYQKALLLAEVDLHERESSASAREFMGRDARIPVDVQRRVEVFRESMREWFRGEGMGSAAAVKLCVEERRHVLCVFHGARFQSEATVDDDGRERMLSFRPLQCDVLSYEPDTGLLRVSARTKRTAEAYREHLGRAWFGDADFFSERPLYTLTSIAVAIGQGSLQPPPPGSTIQSVTLVTCQWQTGEGCHVRVHGPRGRECIVRAQRSGFRTQDCDLTHATLAFFFTDAGRLQRTDVAVRDGNHLRCTRPTHRDAIDLYLEYIGVKGTTDAGAPVQEATTQLVGIQSAGRWQRVLGDELRPAVEAGVLTQATRPAVAVGDSKTAGTSPLVSLDFGGQPMAFARDDDAMVVVARDALVGYELNGQRVAELLRRELGCERSLCSLTIGGAYDLGPFTLGSTRVRPFLLTRFVKDAAAVERHLAAAAAPDKCVSIHLPHANLEDWTCAVPLRTLAAPYKPLRDIIAVLHLEHEVSALERSRGEALAVDTASHVAWLNGAPLDLSEAERATLEALAIAFRTKRPLGAADLAPKGTDAAAGRQRVTNLRAALKRASPGAEKMVGNRRKGEGYTLVGDVYVE